MFLIFLWGSATAKVKRSNVINEYQKGGLRMIDFRLQFDSMKLMWFSKYKDDSHGKWKWMFEYWLGKLGGYDVIMNSKCDPKYLFTMNFKLPEFYHDLLYNTHFSLKFQNPNVNRNLERSQDICKEMLWLNVNIRYKGKMLLFRNWIRSNIYFVGDLVKRNGLLSVNEIRNKLGTFSDGKWFSEYAKCIASLPQIWIKHLKINNVHLFQYFKEKILHESTITIFKEPIPTTTLQNKLIYSELIKRKTETSRAETFWCHKVAKDNKIAWKYIWLFKLSTVQDSILVHFNFRFMYDILPTPVNLNKWKIRDTRVCTECQKEGTIYHVFFACKQVQLFWLYVENLIRIYLKSASFKIKPQFIIYKYNSSDDTKLIDLVLNYALYSIYKAHISKKERETKLFKRDFVYCFNMLIKSRYEIEKHKKKQKVFTELSKFDNFIDVLIS